MEYTTVWNGCKTRPDRGLLAPPRNEAGAVIHPRVAPRSVSPKPVALPRGPGNLNDQALRAGPATPRAHSQIHDVKEWVANQGQATRAQVMSWLMSDHYLDKPSARATVHYAVKANYLEPV